MTYARGGASSPIARFDFVYNPSEAYTYADGTIGPKPGRYSIMSTGTVPTSSNIGQVVSMCTINNVMYASLYQDNVDGLNYFLQSGGTVILMDGTDGPYIKMSSVTVSAGYASTTASVTCGTQKYVDDIVNYDRAEDKSITIASTSEGYEVLSGQRSGTNVAGGVNALRLQANENVANYPVNYVQIKEINVWHPALRDPAACHREKRGITAVPVHVERALPERKREQEEHRDHN